VLILSDDGHTATTQPDGIAELELGAGSRTLQLTLPGALAPRYLGAAPKQLRLEGIVLEAGQAAELRLAIAPDGSAHAVELMALVTVDPRPAHSAAAAAVAPSPPATVEFGSISGRVVARVTGAPLGGVSVFVEGLDSGATSDTLGRFKLSVPEGRHTVWVIHDDFPTLTLKDLEVKANTDSSIDVELVAPTGAHDDWVIRARYVSGGVASILEERRTSATISDALGSEEIAKSPDSSASAATRRIVGASIVGGQYLFARGLGGRYTNVRLNGVPLPSTDPDLPGFQLDLFPAGLLSSLTITKTFSPDIPGDFAGGSLNVVTRAFPDKLKLTLSISSSYNTQTTGRRMPSYTGGNLDFLGIDSGARALPRAVPDQRIWSGSGLSPERLSEISGAFSNVWDVQGRTALPNLSLGASVGDSIRGQAGRFGYLLTLGYRHKFEHYSETITRVGLGALGADPPVVELERLSREIGSREAQLGSLLTLSYEPQPRHRLSAVSLVTQTGEDRATVIHGFSEAEGVEIRNTQLRFIERRLIFNQLTGEHEGLADALSIDWQLNLSRTLRSQPGTSDLLYAAGPSGRLEYRPTSGSGERLYSDLRQADYGAGIDLKIRLGGSRVLKLGYLGRSGERDFSARRFGIQFEGTAQDRALPPEELFAPARAGDTWLIDELTQPEDGFTAHEDLHAAFAMFEGELTQGLELVGGMRLEAFHQQIEVASPFALEGRAAQPGADRSDLDYLPAAALILAPRPDMNIRAGYGATVARPLVRELAPFLNQDFVRRRYARGNPDLQRTFIHNLDVRWELFPTPTEVFAVSGFYKLFKDPIETVVLDQNGNLSFENIEGASNYGAELEARVGLGLLSSALRRFNALANLALIVSNVDLAPAQQRLATRGKRPLAGQSPYVANLALGYEQEEVGVSAYVYYNVFGRRIGDVGRLGLPDVYEEPFQALDATLFWKPAPDFTLGLSANNLLLQPVLQTQGGHDFSRSSRGAHFGLSLAWSPL
jgi:outer membrane receptor protein involved in Fe transport